MCIPMKLLDIHCENEYVCVDVTYSSWRASARGREAQTGRMHDADEARLVDLGTQVEVNTLHVTVLHSTRTFIPISTLSPHWHMDGLCNLHRAHGADPTWLALCMLFRAAQRHAHTLPAHMHALVRMGRWYRMHDSCNVFHLFFPFPRH